jgi:hypothetical protein
MVRRDPSAGQGSRTGMALGLGFGLVLTGCAISAGDGAKEPPAQVLDIRDVDAFALPLDAYAATHAQRLSVQMAKVRLMTHCLERLGLKADLPDPRPRPFQPNTLRYGITKEARAVAFGYSVPEISKRPRTPDLSPQVERAVTGKETAKRVPEGGCEGEADRTLAAGIPGPRPDHTIIGRLGVATLERSERDSRVRAVFARWSGCMKRSGYDYSSPREANGDPAFVDGRKHRVTKHELATAVADVRCKKETNLVNVWAGVETAYQKLAVAQHKAALTSVRRAVETQLKNAAGVRPGPAR